VAIFASREGVDVVCAAIDAVAVAVVGQSAVVDVLVNGSFDLARQVAGRYQAPHQASVPQSTLRVWALPIHDKACTWNHFVHTLCPDADVVFFVDGYAQAQADSLKRLAERLQSAKAALAAAAVPSVGRTAADQRARMIRAPQIHGSLYALSNEAVDAIRRTAFRMPLGIYRGDGLLASAVALGLEAGQSNWSDERVVVVPDATWSRRVPSPGNLRDIVTQVSRYARQCLGAFEGQALKEHLIARRAPASTLPESDLALVTGWIRQRKAAALAVMVRNPLALVAIYRLARMDWSKKDARPTLLAVSALHATTDHEGDQ
jgi:hypothetical protein